jgi:hypothetical protein
MLLDEIVDQFAVCGQCTEGRLFIFPHEAAVAVNVGTQDGGEFALHTHLRVETSFRQGTDCVKLCHRATPRALLKLNCQLPSSPDRKIGLRLVPSVLAHPECCMLHILDRRALPFSDQFHSATALGTRSFPFDISADSALRASEFTICTFVRVASRGSRARTERRINFIAVRLDGGRVRYDPPHH